MDKLERNIKDISNNYYEYLFSLQNVYSVGYGYKYINGKNTFEPCINILVEEKLDTKYLTKNNIIPKTYMGIKTDVIQAKKPVLIETYPTRQSLKTRPLKAGSSISVLGQTWYGTISCIVKKKFKKIVKKNIFKKSEYEYGYEYYILSNEHVLSRYGTVPIGSLIIQPSVTSSLTKTSNIVAMLDTSIPIKEVKFGIRFKNTVDCAIAKLIDTSLISNKVLGLNGGLTGVTKAKLGMRIMKSGATTKVTYGYVERMYESIEYKLPNNKFAFFKDQISFYLKCDPGDSGSPVVTSDNKLIAILKSRTSEYSCSGCDINNVLKELKAEVYTGENL